jgi:hypothetical protein
MFLLLKDAPEGVRANYALAKCDVKYYPKRAPKTCLIDGETVDIKITGSRNYATAQTAGNNGYLMIKGDCYWMSFAAGFPAHTADLVFELKDGTSPDENPLREPKDPVKEKARRENLSRALREKFAADDAAEAAEDLEDATA